MKIIVSTYGVLYDALCHGFVATRKLALCVFDEAHHCTKKHASNMIMQQFYKPAKSAKQPVFRSGITSIIDLFLGVAPMQKF
jgi:ERCC4-related helicase